MFNAANNGKTGGFSFGQNSGTSGGLGLGSSGGSSLFGAKTAAAPSEAPKAGGFSFGAATEAPKTSGFSLGGASGGSLFGAAKTEAPKAGGFSFGTPTAAPATSAPAAPAFGGLGSTAAAAPAAPAFGGFGATAAATPAFGALSGLGSTAAPAAAPAKTGFGFGSAATPSTAAGSSKPLAFGATSSAETKSVSFGATSSAPADPTAGTGLGGFKLSTAPTVSASTTVPSTAAASTTLTSTATTSAGKQSETSQPPSVPTEKAADLANSALRGKTLEEIAQMWTSELATQTRAFHTQARTVGYWDGALVQQGQRITELYEATMGVEAEQAALDQSLEHMEGQQSALRALLDTYEGRVQGIVRRTAPPAGRNVAMSADEERGHVYASAERLNQQLDELARRLTTLVEDVNEVSSATPASDARSDPFAQIVQILNAHLTSLEWVDAQTAQLHDRVKSAQRVYQDVTAAQSLLPENVPELTIPGAFVNDAPPVTMSFGTPATARKPARSTSTPWGRGF
ncbi:FG-nucleoporin nsp1 [Coemansia sp. RSA 353]|nr:FG-nucleoporin nsp1 [Coemansia sp. RSA 1591]KAJ2136782.1 FG-nucleoporin nsp1 [Coemansia sp. RSA 788]KAJ2140447.1 FG-nucleoporin nsp1 [Coemansia sp. RSA 564]KAJ2167425.1 FG-nucleoporin nsp1 [Coemansia sp. RSA 562]KAJ2198346.1 FG-nucleoporin nsp1 [Coemansia sp. RSA 522]KAJ2206027.1 FG-nucleoporin nsp1 [Coemansia sp. RSA 521]KAJ2228865.1 FG-nucleoporin nsp1 [Coemansia sp. RSA 518]KAJ2250517.1 FG-nucleoporin nsp1 [Coemansia sp. RSA 475]KAJ2300098.1 FG-nucleoporin nsp1 [Coemansia sp. RSA 353]